MAAASGGGEGGALPRPFFPLSSSVRRVKVVIQTQDMHPGVASGAVPRYTFRNAWGRLVKEGGLAALWHGNLPYTFRHVPPSSQDTV